MPDGKIRWREAGQIFGSPSAWAIHCKKIVKPMKKSGCGWASVRYNSPNFKNNKTIIAHLITANNIFDFIYCYENNSDNNIYDKPVSGNRPITDAFTLY